MIRLSKPLTRMLTGAVALGFVLTATGCPLFGAPRNGKTNLTLALTTGESALKAGPVDVGDVESLIVTVTSVTFTRAGDDDDEEEEETEEKQQVEVFSGELDVDLVDLTALSEVLSSQEIDAGSYTRIVLDIANPRLILAEDPETVITDVQLTANGRLFVNQSFTLPANQSSLIVLDFGGLHLVETGAGKFVLTPQLQATVGVQSADAQAAGVVAELDTEADTFVLDLGEDGAVDIVYTDAQIFLPGDTDTPTGTEADLLDGISVEVQGTLFVDGSINATVIVILE